MSASINRGLRLIFVGLFFALMFSYAGAIITLNVTRGRLLTPLVRGWLVTQKEGRLVVSYVSPEGPASQLQFGDEIMAVDGQPLSNVGQMYSVLGRIEPGRTCSLTVIRSGRELSLTLRSPPPSRLMWIQYVLSAVTTAIFLLSGFVLFLFKPFDRVALALALFFGTIVVAPVPLFNPSNSILALMVVGSMISAFSAPLFFRFTLNFPVRSTLLRTFPQIEWGSFLPTLFFSAPFAGVVVIFAKTARSRLAAPPFPLLNKISTLVFLLYLVGGLLSFSVSYQRLAALERRGVRVILVATLVAAAPLIAIQSLTLVLNGPVNPLSGGPMNRLGASIMQLGWLSVIRLATAWILPPVWAYAILRHQVIPIRLMIRRSVQYLLAKSALRILIALPAIGIVFTIIRHRNQTLTELLFRNSLHFYLLTTVAAVLIFAFHQRLRNWIDRKFFREAYNQERILLQLIEIVKGCDSISEMSKCVTEKVDQALHPEHIYLFYRAERTRDLSLSYTSHAQSQGLIIPEESELLRIIDRQHSTQIVPLPETGELPESEKEWLRLLGIKLIVRISGTNNRLDGLLLLGEKKSESPYTKGDRELLHSLANQIAVVYENVRLKEQVQQETRLRNEVLARVESRQINLLKECPDCGACYNSSDQVCALDQSELTLALPVERTIENRYRLERIIGKGGMGAVYQAEDLRLNRKVAVKILMGKLFGDDESLRRFEREAQMLAKLNHPHIITTFDYGVLETAGAYLVMELLTGETLGHAIKRDGFLIPTVVAELFDQLLDALEAAHRAHIIHRDLKPENLFISYAKDGEHQLKILDFGLAKIIQAQTDSKGPRSFPVTIPGMILGTMGYMSPEQLIGAAVDERSDLFSVGVIVVEALTGRRPFSGMSTRELISAVLNQSSSFAGHLTGQREIDDVLSRCLARDPAQRFSSALELRHELIPAIKRYSRPNDTNSIDLEAETEVVRLTETRLSRTINPLGVTVARSHY